MSYNNQYAHKHSGKFRDIFASIKATRFCGSDKIYEVSLLEDPDGPYYSWLPTDKTEPCMIFSSYLLFNTCFTYGVEREVERGRGRIIRLQISEVKEIE